MYENKNERIKFYKSVIPKIILFVTWMLKQKNIFGNELPRDLSGQG